MSVRMFRSRSIAGVFIALTGCHSGARDPAGAQPSARSAGDHRAPAPAVSAVSGPAIATPTVGAANEPAPAPTTRSFKLTKSGGIGFDDLLFSSELHALLAPAGGTGCVHLFDSTSLEETPICGVSPSGGYEGGHGEGTTSADVGAGLLFAIDRNSQALKFIDPKARGTAGSVHLAGGPDYVRWNTNQRQIWVTEPDREQIEIFSLANGAPPKVSLVGATSVRGGPESLVIDARRGKAFTHLWSGRTVAIDVSTRAVSRSFDNGCKGSRGIAFDSERGLLFVGCAEGRAVVIDVDHENRITSNVQTPAGVDIISVNVTLHHLYIPASSDGSLTVFGYGPEGALNRLGSVSVAKGTHCAASDDRRHVWVCAPDQGALLMFEDTFPAS